MLVFLQSYEVLLIGRKTRLKTVIQIIRKRVKSKQFFTANVLMNHI